MNKTIFFTLILILLTTIVLSGCAQHVAGTNDDHMHCSGLVSRDENLFFSVDPSIDPDWIP